jgi:hypothetical protein
MSKIPPKAPKLPAKKFQTSQKAGQTGPLDSGFHHSPVAPEQQISDDPSGNLTPIIPAAPLAHYVFSLLLRPSFASPMVGASLQTAPDLRVKKAPSRQSRSCKVCRARKVKVRETRESSEVLRSRIANGRDGPSRPLPCFTELKVHRSSRTDLDYSAQGL